MQVQIAYKFIFGFLIVLFIAITTPYLINTFQLPEVAEKIASTLTAVTFGLLIGLVLSKNISKNMKQITNLLGMMSSGILTFEIQRDIKVFKDEIDIIIDSIEKTKDNLKNIISENIRTSDELSRFTENLTEASKKIEASANEISIAIENVSIWARKGNEVVEKTLADMKTLTELSDLTSKKVEEVNNFSSNVIKRTRTGLDVSTLTTEKLKNIFEEIERVSKNFLQYAERFEEIKNIIRVISNISNKTNILAVNAAIEAVKAGEVGKGFGVVADEIRRLADSAQRETEEIERVVKEIMRDEATTIELIELILKKIKDGRSDINTISLSLGEIDKSIYSTNEKLSEILNISSEQKIVAQKVEKLMEEISRITDENISVTNQVSVAVSKQVELTNGMNNLFKSMMDSAILLKTTSRLFRI